MLILVIPAALIVLLIYSMVTEPARKRKIALCARLTRERMEEIDRMSDADFRAFMKELGLLPDFLFSRYWRRY